MNKDNEKFVFSIFLELHRNLSSWVESESPDFIVNQNNKLIGFELIELMEDGNQLHPSPARYSLEDKIAKATQKQYDLKSGRKIMAALQILENFNLPLNKIDHLGQQIAEILSIKTKESPYILSHNLEKNENLPSGIQLISFDITPYLSESHISVMRGKWTGSFNLNDLNRAIRKKEDFVASYGKKADKVYLLIIEGFSFSSYLGPFEKSGSIMDNSFDKIFLLKIMSRELFEIK